MVLRNRNVLRSEIERGMAFTLMPLRYKASMPKDLLKMDERTFKLAIYCTEAFREEAARRVDLLKPKTSSQRDRLLRIIDWELECELARFRRDILGGKISMIELAEKAMSDKTSPLFLDVLSYHPEEAIRRFVADNEATNIETRIRFVEKDSSVLVRKFAFDSLKRTVEKMKIEGITYLSDEIVPLIVAPVLALRRTIAEEENIYSGFLGKLEAAYRAPVSP